MNLPQKPRLGRQRLRSLYMTLFVLLISILIASGLMAAAAYALAKYDLKLRDSLAFSFWLRPLQEG